MFNFTIYLAEIIGIISLVFADFLLRKIFLFNHRINDNEKN
jgi:putative flippase GtrA